MYKILAANRPYFAGTEKSSHRQFSHMIFQDIKIMITHPK